MIELCYCPEVVEGLGQEAGYVDGVSAGELHVSIQVGIHEGRFDQALAIVEGAVNLKGGDVLSQGGELLLLDKAYLAFGVEYIDVDAGYAQEAVGYGTACVAGGGDEDVDY